MIHYVISFNGDLTEEECNKITNKFIWHQRGKFKIKRLLDEDSGQYIISVNEEHNWVTLR